MRDMGRDGQFSVESYYQKLSMRSCRMKWCSCISRFCYQNDQKSVLLCVLDIKGRKWKITYVSVGAICIHVQEKMQIASYYIVKQLLHLVEVRNWFRIIQQVIPTTIRLTLCSWVSGRERTQGTTDSPTSSYVGNMKEDKQERFLSDRKCFCTCGEYHVSDFILVYYEILFWIND